MNVDSKIVDRITELVTAELAKQKSSIGASHTDTASETGNKGIFKSVNAAVEAAYTAQKQLQRLKLEDRKRITDSIIETLGKHVEELSKMSLEETGMGNYEDKLTKHKNALYQTKSVEDLLPHMATDDTGVALYEFAPFGVIGALTPSTNPSESIINNSIVMIAAGNSVVFSTHPGAFRTSNRAVELANEAILKAGGPKNLITSIDAPTMEKTEELMAHPKVIMLCATGGPGVVKAVLSSGKKAIGAGAGNPPVLVDETADVANAAKSIVAGASYDYNIPCIAEKAAVAVNSIADELIRDMQKHGAYLVKDSKIISEMTKLLMPAPDSPNKKFIGKSPAHIMSQFGIKLGNDVRLIIFEADQDHPLVMNEQMMPVLPIVKVRNAQEGIDLCVEIEGGRRHTAICHSKNLDVVTEMARKIQTTIFVSNGPSFAGVGVGGVGNAALTIAGPTGEGLTSPITFTRKRKVTMVNSLNVR